MRAAQQATYSKRDTEPTGAKMSQKHLTVYRHLQRFSPQKVGRSRDPPKSRLHVDSARGLGNHASRHRSQSGFANNFTTQPHQIGSTLISEVEVAVQTSITFGHHFHLPLDFSTKTTSRQLDLSSPLLQHHNQSISQKVTAAMAPFLVVDDAAEVSQESKPEATTQTDNKNETTTTEGTINSTKDDAKSEPADKKADTNGDAKSDASDDEPEPKKKVDAAEPMKAELKHLDRKYSEKHKWYFAETVEDKAVPDQVDW